MEPFWAESARTDPQMHSQCLDETPLFGQLGLDMVFDPTALGYLDEMASAPTPYMAPTDTAQDDLFGDIDTDDLMSPTEEVEIGTHCLEITGEPEVLNNAPPTTSDDLPGHSRAATRANKRKYEVEYEDDSDAESVSTYTSKSKAGRKPSKGGQKCMSRNAIAARENREKKKQYIEHMEKRLKVSEDENKRLKVQMSEIQKNYDKLVKENEYHKGVLANSSTISTLIKELASTNKIELIGTSFVESSKPSVANTAADSKVRKSHRIASTKGDTSPAISGHSSGICLHIHNKKVSLELCAKCSQKQNRKGK